MCAGAFRDLARAFRVIGKVLRGTDARRLAGLLAQPLAAQNGSNYREPVWHCAVRAAPEDRLLSDAEWAQVAAAIMDRTGLAPAGDDLAVRWVAVRHAPDHIHLVGTLARQDQIRPKVWNDYFRVREACQDAERLFGLRSTAPADRTAARRPTRAESEQAIRRGWEEPPRARLRREVCTAAAGARTEHEFFTRLAQAGVLVRRRYSTVNPGRGNGLRRRPAPAHWKGRPPHLVRRREARGRSDAAQAAHPVDWAAGTRSTRRCRPVPARRRPRRAPGHRGPGSRTRHQ